MEPVVRHPRREATELLGDGRVGRVLEPSPPAVADGEWFADDPPASGDVPDGVEVVGPTRDADVLWSEVAEDDPAVAAFARRLWLGPVRRLEPPPPRWEVTRHALHQLAFFVLAPRRYEVTGKLGLRWTSGGLGTPFFEDGAGDEQVRLEDGLLVVQMANEVRVEEPGTLRDAARFLGIELRDEWFEDFHDPLEMTDPDEPLAIEASAATWLGDWFGFATLVLERLRATPGAVDPSRPQLWPEHLDPACELGDADEGSRASFGASPGDDGHELPYLYVSPWDPDAVGDGDEFFADPDFGGATLTLDVLLAEDDQVDAALSFLREGARRLGALTD